MAHLDPTRSLDTYSTVSAEELLETDNVTLLLVSGFKEPRRVTLDTLCEVLETLAVGEVDDDDAKDTKSSKAKK